MDPITADDFSPVQKLYDQGLYLQAYRATVQLRPLAEWRGGPARVLAGRVAGQVGAPRLSQGHFLLALREAPELPEVRYFYALTLAGRRGPYAAWRRLEKWGELEDAPPKMQAHWYALHGLLAGALRDFDTAERWQARAEGAAPDDAWVMVQRSALFHQEDRYEDALAAALQALVVRPWYRPAVEAVAHTQIQLGRDEEALAFLAEADEHIECAAVVSRQIGLLMELERYQEARERFERLSDLLPLPEKEYSKWLAGQRSIIAYFLNDIESAILFGQQSEDPFLARVAEHLQEPERRGARRVVLPLPFVRQHHETCVPATLTIISRFWSKAAEHLEIADQICYHGTTAYHEREWAGQNGWLAREFTVTEESIALLIDEGLPFTLSIVWPSNAHMQAAMGYDGRRGTMVVRDPFFRNAGEILIEEFLAQQAAYGPRGMALVPADQREKLAGLELPDEALWDQLHRFDDALERHRWPEAKAIYQGMVASDPEHRLTLNARLRLAAYDANPVAMLEAVEPLLTRYPENESLHVARLAWLAELGRREEMLASYRELRARAGANPIFTMRYAGELAMETAQQGRAIRLLNWALGRWPTEAGGYFTLGNILWSQRQHEEALALYRFAAWLKDKDEEFARKYFGAAHHLGREEEGLAFLRRRWERLGQRSSLTGRTLAWAYGQLGQWDEAAAVLEEALARHPDDGELMLEAADLLAQASDDHHERVDELLAAARDKAPRRQWLRSAAARAARQGDQAAELEFCRQILAIQPLAMDAHWAAARLLASTENPDAGLDHLHSYAAQFPHFYPLHERLADWYRYLQREKEYLVAAEKLVELAPQNEIALGYLGEAQLRNSQYQRAYDTFRKALQLNPAYDFAGYSLFDLQLKESELVEAAATLRLLEEHSEGALTTARSLQLAVRKREWQKAISDLKKLCVMPDAGDWALPTAVNEMKAANRSEEALDTLDEALDWPDAIPKVGALWMKGCLEEEDHQLWFIYFLARRLLGRLFESRYAKFLQELTAKGAIGERATATYLGHLIEWGRHSELRRFIRREGHWLRKNDATWYYTADALQRMGSGKERRGWALHWRELKEPEAWMLLLAAELFWEHGQMDEAGAVCQAALKLPADGSTSAHRILLSAQMVLAGDTERAGMELAPVDSSTLNNYGRFIYQMTDAAVQISAAAPSDRWKRFKGVRRPVQDVVKAVREERRKNRAYRRLYRQALWHIGREVGDIRAWIWCLWMFLRW